MALQLILGELAYADALIGGSLTEHMMDENQGIRVRKTDTIKSKASHSEPPEGQRSHYSGRKSYRPRGSVLGNINVPDKQAETILTRTRKPFTPTTGPQPQQAPAPEPEHSAATGQHGSVGALQDHGHSAGVRANITPSSYHQDIRTSVASKKSPSLLELSEVEKRIQKLKQQPLSGLPAKTSNMERMITLARLNYMREMGRL